MRLSASPRPLWFLAPGGMPIQASDRTPKGITHQCHECDREWTPVGESARRAARAAQNEGWPVETDETLVAALDASDRFMGVPGAISTSKEHKSRG